MTRKGYDAQWGFALHIRVQGGLVSTEWEGINRGACGMRKGEGINRVLCECMKQEKSVPKSTVRIMGCIGTLLGITTTINFNQVFQQ